MEIPSRAQEILDNPVYEQTFDALRKTYYENWRKASPESAERTYWGTAHDMLDDVDQHIQAQMGSAIIEDFQQKRREA